ncbi:MAG: hypothetical protein M1827_001089 [Pycnora praestabilis]|nr:MAG: hypothetical protein M1827_001089 [Pycnora praestabilis]
MFYSHEGGISSLRRVFWKVLTGPKVLTSRKYGVATVWLVATLGSKSNLKKVNRKAILDVDVPKACQTILTPEAPMALRLQSNLLYGVSRVYSQQCGYVLVDAQNAQNNIRALMKVIRTAELDLPTGAARPDQLILQDDPAFLPDFILPDLDFNLSKLDLSSSAVAHRSSVLSPYSQQSSRSSRQDAEDSALGLIIPTSDTGNSAGVEGFLPQFGDISSLHRDSVTAALDPFGINEEDGFFPDVDFEFDAEGNVRELGGLAPERAMGIADMGRRRIGNDSVAVGRVQLEHEEGLQAGQLGDPMELNDSIPLTGDDFNLLPEAEPFPENFTRGILGVPPAVQDREEEPSSQSAEAPQRRKRKGPQILEMDLSMELRNADLAQWNQEYLENMTEVVRYKQVGKALRQAKKNASFWVFGTGIGGIGSGVGTSMMKSPLNMFSGQQLMQVVTGLDAISNVKKRGRQGQEEDTSDSEGRRVRAREHNEDQIGRGDDDVMFDAGGMVPVLDDERVEVGREAPGELQDPSSAMPWNVSASLSRQGSSMVQGRGFPGSIGGFPTSAGRPSSLFGAESGSLPRRLSRLTSASPLLGRGRPSGLERLSSLEIPEHDDEDELLGGRADAGDELALNDFEIYGPGANVDTQTAAQSQWMKETLNRESFNFLEFLGAGVDKERYPADGDQDELAGEEPRRGFVLFRELLPPTENTKMVAAQALLHTLALATENLITVNQNEGYGDIRMELASRT